MTRAEAIEILYQIINSEIISYDLQESLREIADNICGNTFLKCEIDPRSYECEGCKYLEK